ncbi:hypothetical protein V1511DRAFT_492401 [Dipodascopsis uninucleata]
MAPPFLLDIILRERSNLLLQSSASDYRQYAKHLSSRVHRLRKTLKVRRRIPARSTGQSTEDASTSRKYSVHVPTAEELANDKRSVGLLLFTAERSWAHAMEWKATIENGSSDSVAAKKRHILSKLEKARKNAAALLEILSPGLKDWSPIEYLQCEAYASVLAGLAEFERRKYERAAESYAIAWVSLGGLIESIVGAETVSDDANDTADLYRDLLNRTVEPSLKFAARQIDENSRAETVGMIAIQQLSNSGRSERISELVRTAIGEKRSKNILAPGSDGRADALATVESVTWRNHSAPLKDAAIASAILIAREQEEKIASSDAASGFDDALLAWQDAVTAIDDAISEAESEDSQEIVQELYIVSTYTRYRLLTLRITRDLVLIKPLLKRALQKSKNGKISNNLSVARGIVRLYDEILMSVDEIAGLPGVASDDELSSGLAALQSFYKAERCATIASSSRDASSVETLALWTRADAYANAADVVALANADPDSPLFKIDVKDTTDRIERGKLYSHGLVSITKANSTSADKGLSKGFLIDQLSAFPGAIDVTKLVDLDINGSNPKIEPIPAKPVFFDIAFNYVGADDELKQDTSFTTHSASGNFTSASFTSVSTLSSNTTSPSVTSTEAKKTGWFWRR